MPPIGVELSKSLPPEIWRQFWKCGFWDTLYVSIIKININRSAPWGRRRGGRGGVWLGWQGVGWHLQVGAELVIRMVTLKQRAYYMSIKYGLFDQIIHQGATMTVRSLSLFVTRTTMLLVNIDTQTYSSECWKILIFLYDIWYYKIFSVYWTVQCIDLTCKLPDFKALQFLLSGGLQGECTFSWWVWLTIAVLLLCLLASVRTCSPLYRTQLLKFLTDLRAVTATGCGKLSWRCNNCWKQRESSHQFCFNILIVFFRSAPVSAFPAAVCTIAAPQL